MYTFCSAALLLLPEQGEHYHHHETVLKFVAENSILKYYAAAGDDRPLQRLREVLAREEAEWTVDACKEALVDRWSARSARCHACGERDFLKLLDVVLREDAEESCGNEVVMVENNKYRNTNNTKATKTTKTKTKITTDDGRITVNPVTSVVSTTDSTSCTPFERLRMSYTSDFYFQALATRTHCVIVFSNGAVQQQHRLLLGSGDHHDERFEQSAALLELILENSQVRPLIFFVAADHHHQEDDDVIKRLFLKHPEKYRVAHAGSQQEIICCVPCCFHSCTVYEAAVSAAVSAAVALPAPSTLDPDLVDLISRARKYDDDATNARHNLYVSTSSSSPQSSPLSARTITLTSSCSSSTHNNNHGPRRRSLFVLQRKHETSADDENTHDSGYYSSYTLHQPPTASSDDHHFTSATWKRDLFEVILRAHVVRCDEKVLPFYDYVMRRCRAKQWFAGIPPPPPTTSLFCQNPDFVLRKKVIVAIDNRRNPLTIFAILQTLTCLVPGEWSGVVVFTTPQAAQYYRDNLSDALFNNNSNVAGDGVGATEMDMGLEIISDGVPCLSRTPFDIEDYNDLLTSPFVWDALLARGYETALMVQDDGFLVRPGLDEAYELFDYDYVGAPWLDAPVNAYLKSATRGLLTGNGGLSLRRVEAMLAVTKQRPRTLFFNGIQREPEDVYFALGTVESWASRSSASTASFSSAAAGGLAPHSVARKFSSEQVLDAESFGVHKPWAYHDPEAVRVYLLSTVRC
jgi:hypothetical protein